MLECLLFVCGMGMGVFIYFKQMTAFEMLRSLVGSEVCIRDGLHFGLLHVGVLHVGVLHVGALHFWCVVEFWCVACCPVALSVCCMFVAVS